MHCAAAWCVVDLPAWPHHRRIPWCRGETYARFLCLKPCMSLPLGVGQQIPVAHALSSGALSIAFCEHSLPLLRLLCQDVFAACKVAGYIFGYGTYTGDSSTLQEETREPLIGRGTESA